MTNLVHTERRLAADAAPARPAQGTIRIEHDRKRLALAAAASGLAALVIPCMFFVGNLHAERAAPAWTLLPVGIAVLVAALGFVRSIVRLQDGDPALVLSPRGLDFRPHLFGEIVRIPWKAVRGFKSRRYKQQRFIVVQVVDLDRYAPRVGFTALLRQIGKRRFGAEEISFSTPMAKAAWNELEATLKRYLAQHGSPAATSASANPNGAAASAVSSMSRNPQSRSVP